MANYYTYGAVPDADETVFGPSVDPAGLDAAAPVDRGLPEEQPVGPSPLSFADEEPVGALTPIPQEEPVGPESLPKTTVTEPTGTGINQDAMTNLFNLLGQNQSMEPIGGLGVFAPSGNSVKAATPVTQTLADLGLTQAEADEIAKNFNKAAMAPAPLTQLSKEEIAKAAGVSVADLEKSEAQIGAVYEPRQKTLESISALLKSNDFAGAFAVATKAEQELGQDFIGNIVSPDKFRYLRGPMTADEIKKFYAEMPESVFKEKYVGPGNVFSKEQAIERNIAALDGGSGYADPTLGIKKEETLLSKLPIKELAALAAAAMGATAIPGLFGAGSAGGAGAAGGAAGGAGAAGAGAGAAGAAGLTGVVPTGLVAGTTAANLALPVFTVTAGGGLTAAQIAALAAAGGAGALAGSGGASTGSAASTPSTPEPPLEEVVVTGSKPPILPPAVAAPVVGGLANVAAQPPAPEPPLEEVVIETTKPTEPPVVTPPVVTTPSTPVDTVTPEGPLDEVVIETTKPTEPPPVVPPVVTTPSTPVDTVTPEGPLDEVVIETTKPTEPPVITPPVVTTPSTPIDTVSPEGPLDEVVIETTKPTPPPDLIIPPVVIPPTTPVDIPKEPPKVNQPETTTEDKLKSLLDKYGTLENFLKLLGALGSAASGTRKPVAPPTAPTGGLGGALPKYTYTRKQLSPDIDYYTYGTRPEAKFFEDTVQLEKPVQPPLSEPESPPANPPGNTEDMVVGTQATIPAIKDGVEGYYTDSTMKVFVPNKSTGKAKGGLTGYAKGGSKSSRYVDGPGSGREDKIPALLSDGEYVIDAETLALLGDGSTKEGARRMDQFRANIRKHKGRALSRGRISPNAKSPSKYMGGGLT
jgi:hypothetical protein